MRRPRKARLHVEPLHLADAGVELAERNRTRRLAAGRCASSSAPLGRGVLAGEAGQLLVEVLVGERKAERLGVLAEQCLDRVVVGRVRGAVIVAGVATSWERPA